MLQMIRTIGYFGNGAIAALFALGAVVGISKGHFSVVLVCVATCGVAIFNIQIMGWALRLTSEEEWLKAEVRKAELRRQLTGLSEFTPKQAQEVRG